MSDEGATVTVTGELGAERAPRTFLDGVAESWRGTREPLFILAALVLAGQCVFLVANPPLPGVSGGRWIWFAIALAQGVALLGRRRWPLAVLLGQSAAMLAAEVIAGIGGYCWLPVAAALAAVAVSSRAVVVVGGVAAVVLASRPVGIGFADLSRSLAPERLVPTMLVIVLAVGAAFGFRARAQVLAARDAELTAAARARSAEQQREAARSQSRLAGELHDSVGHDLTAIIALSEGLHGADPELDEAIGTINDLARAGLDDTRRAVTALRRPDGDEGADGVLGAVDGSTLPGASAAVGRSGLPDGTPPVAPPTRAVPPPRTWDDLAVLAAEMRQTGLLVALTETGARPDDPAAAELCFRVVRESLTNVLRHAAGADRVVVALDHGPDGTTVTATDDGAGTEPGRASGGGGAALGDRRPARSVAEGICAAPSDLGGTGVGGIGVGGTGFGGTGLVHLDELVREAGGRFSAGPAVGGWTVRAEWPIQVSRPVSGTVQLGRSQPDAPENGGPDDAA